MLKKFLLFSSWPERKLTVINVYTGCPIKMTHLLLCQSVRNVCPFYSQILHTHYYYYITTNYDIVINLIKCTRCCRCFSNRQIIFNYVITVNILKVRTCYSPPPATGPVACLGKQRHTSPFCVNYVTQPTHVAYCGNCDDDE